MNNVNKACYVWDENLIEHCDRLPAVLGRATLVHNLISAYHLVDHIQVVRSTPASYDELRAFHSELYLDHLKSFTQVDDEYMTSSQDEEYGIGYDCPPVCNMFDLVSALAGGSITAARCLTLGSANIAINWCGGWHHAQRFSAEGFCYVNDIVLAIETLKQKFPKVLYIDLDVHHGNGVQDAYNLSKSVFTLSFHKYEAGFYPGTGAAHDIGALAGEGYTCNFPLHESYSDETLQYVFDKVFPAVCAAFAPDAAVVQCGADALAGDPHGGANLTAAGVYACLQAVLHKRIPTLLLGGGGYMHPNAARLWTSLTSLAAGVTLDDNIPEHSHWMSYGPYYMLPVEPTLARDSNKKSYLDNCIAIILGNLEKYLEDAETVSDKGPEFKRRKTDLLLENNKPKHVVSDEYRVKNNNPKQNAVAITNDVYDFLDE